MKKSFITHHILPLILLIMSLSMLIVCDDGGKKDDKKSLTLMAINEYEDYLAQKALDDQENAIGGSVSGLNGTLILQNNGGDDLTISGDGPFKFSSLIKRGKEYNATIKQQPGGPVCDLFNGKGTALSEVDDIIVVCSYRNYPVSVTVKGLTGKLSLLNNGIEPLAVESDGSYLFNQPIVKGGRYRITMTSKPNTQSCTVNNAEGPVEGPVQLDVNCSTISYKISGTVKGLKEGSIILQNNAGDDITMNSNGNFAFKEPVVKDSNYNVTVRSQAGIKPCRVVNGAGKATKDVTDVSVVCSYRVVLYSAGLYNGNMGGPDGADSKCVARGSESGLEAPYTAFICKSGSASIRNMPATYGFPDQLPITTPGGAIIADNWTNLINGPLKASPATLVDAGGRNTPFWSGCDTTGQYKGERNCGNYSWWLSLGLHGNVPVWSTTSCEYSTPPCNGWTGLLTLSNNGWLSQRETDCTQNSWLLCAAYGPEPASGLTAYLHLNSVRPAVVWVIIIGGVIVSIGAIIAIGIIRKKRRNR